MAMYRYIAVCISLAFLATALGQDIDCEHADTISQTTTCMTLYNETQEEQDATTIEELWDHCENWTGGAQNREFFSGCKTVLAACGSNPDHQEQTLGEVIAFLDAYEYGTCTGTDNVRECSEANKDACNANLYGWLQLDGDSTAQQIAEAYTFLVFPMVLPFTDRDLFCRTIQPDLVPDGLDRCATLYAHCNHNPTKAFDRVTYTQIRNNYCGTDCDNIAVQGAAVAACAENDAGTYTVWALSKRINQNPNVTPADPMCQDLKAIRDCTHSAIGQCYTLSYLVANSNKQDGGDLVEAGHTCDIGIMGASNYYGDTDDTPSIAAPSGPTSDAPIILSSVLLMLLSAWFLIMQRL